MYKRQGGLLVGLLGNNSNIPIIGVSVRANKEKQEKMIFDLAQRTADHVGCNAKIPREAVNVVDDYVGAGYSVPTDEMVEAVQLLARTEGILLDPVYTGKAMSGLMGLIRKGHFKKDDNVLFIHTGGSPALYAYQPTILAE